MISCNFSILEHIAPSWCHISALINARVVISRVDVVTLRDQMVRVADLSQQCQGIRQGRGTRGLLYFLCPELMAKVTFSGLSSRRKILRLLWREKLCKKTLYSGIELIFEFSKQCLSDNQNLFLIASYCLCLFGESAWHVWRVLVAINAYSWYCEERDCTYREPNHYRQLRDKTVFLSVRNSAMYIGWPMAPTRRSEKARMQSKVMDVERIDGVLFFF